MVDKIKKAKTEVEVKLVMGSVAKTTIKKAEVPTAKFEFTGLKNPLSVPIAYVDGCVKLHKADGETIERYDRIIAKYPHLKEKIVEDMKPFATGVLDYLETTINITNSAHERKEMDLEIAKENAEKKASSRGTYGTGAVVISLIGAGAAGLVYGHDQFNHGKDSGYGQGHTDGIADGIVIEKSVTHLDLEGKILNETRLPDGKWNGTVVNETVKLLYGAKKTLTNLTASELNTVYGALNFQAGQFNTSTAKDITELIKREINTIFDVSLQNESLTAIKNPLDAMRLYALLAVNKEAAGIRGQGYEEGKAAILANVPTWCLQNYTLGKGDGAQDILNQTSGWGNINYTLGKKDGAQDILNQTPAWGNTNISLGKGMSLQEILGVVGAMLAQDPVKDSGNITQILNTAIAKIKADAYVLADYTSQKIVGEKNQTEAELELNRVGALYGDVFITHGDNGTKYQSLAKNLTQEDINETIRAGINLTDKFNKGYDLRFTDTFGDKAVLSAYSKDSVIRAEVSQQLMNKIKDWNSNYIKGGK